MPGKLTNKFVFEKPLTEKMQTVENHTCFLSFMFFVLGCFQCHL